jgi:hypothetical protein
MLALDRKNKNMIHYGYFNGSNVPPDQPRVCSRLLFNWRIEVGSAKK